MSSSGPEAALPPSCEVREVGPRDGLQNEAPVPVSARVRLIDALSLTGVRRIEAASFVRPDAIPAMAGAEEVLGRIERVPGVRYSALVPNPKGALRALEAGADELEAFVSVSETHNRRNVRRSVSESLDNLAAVIDLAHQSGRQAEVVLATSFGCPYEGDVDPGRVAVLAGQVRGLGADQVCFGDTTGMATPPRVHRLVDALEAAGIATDTIALHFHDTRGTGLANAYAALLRGVRRFDASVGGMGGCPYAPGATGNIATEDLVHLAEDMGVATGIDLGRLIGVAHLAEEIVGRRLPGAVMRAGPRSALVPTAPVSTTSPAPASIGKR